MRVAIVCYYSPPQSAIAAHRVLRMTRAALAAGHTVHWVTADLARLPASSLDASLAPLIPADVVVHGIDGQALITKPVAANLWEKLLRTLAWHLPRRFRFPDSFISWARQLRRHLPGLVQTHSLDAVVLCCSPHNQILVLPELRRRCPRLRIFVDYRDLLSGNPWNPRPNPRQVRRITELERAMLRHADVLFLNTDAARAQFLAAVGSIDGLSVEVMRNAADYQLAAGLEGHTKAVELGPGVHLGFFGTLFPRRRLRPVLAALAALAARDPTQFGRLTLHVYCDPDDSRRLLEADLRELSAEVSGRVRRHDYLPYAKALRAMQAMDALVLVNGPDESDAVFVPGKVYDYLMARRPILFVGHEGEASALVARACGGDAADWCYPYDATPALAGRLAALLAGRIPDLAARPEFAPADAFAPLLRRLDAATER